MEGCFPLATKMFMQYCMDIPSSEKIGKQKNETKLLTKIAYKKHLPVHIINKYKTGWTVPIGYWLTMNMSKDIKKFYESRVAVLNAHNTNAHLNIVKASQKAGKALLPAWIINDWLKTYKIQL